MSPLTCLLATLLPVERVLITGSLADALRYAAAAADDDERATVKPVAP